MTKIHSISGLLDAGAGLLKERPFRAPHHNVSLNALIGGGSYAQPGEVVAGTLVPVSASMKDALDSGWKPHMARS